MFAKNYVYILGISVNKLTLKEAKSRILDAWQEKKFFHVATANAEMIYASRNDKQLAAILQHADMVTADGAGVVVASRLLGSPLPERVAGFDLMVKCLEEAQKRSIPVYFLGAKPEVLPEALQKVYKCFPDIPVAGSSHGYFKKEEEEGILEDIRILQPGLLLVALGVPRQEKWIYEHKNKLPPCVTIGVGGSFDVLAGKSKRAPLWIQRAGLEWFYRALNEPSRFRRVAVLPLFLLFIIFQVFGFIDS